MYVVCFIKSNDWNIKWNRHIFNKIRLIFLLSLLNYSPEFELYVPGISIFISIFDTSPINTFIDFFFRYKSVTSRVWISWIPLIKLYYHRQIWADSLITFCTPENMVSVRMELLRILRTNIFCIWNVCHKNK